METKKNRPSRVRGKVSIAAVVLMLYGGVWIGCVSHDSHLKLSYSVQDQFERSWIYSGLQYYYSGTMEDPLALVALEPDVMLESTAWQATEMTGQQLYSWVRAFKMQPWIEYNQIPDGAVITDPQGNRVGFYYSIWKYPRVRFLDANRIKIDQPVAELRVTNRNTVDD